MSVPGARIRIASMGALLLACTACGFKGPLYLPERNATVITHPAQATQEAPSPGQTSPGQTQTPAAKTKSKTSQPPSSPRAPAPQSSPPPPQ